MGATLPPNHELAARSHRYKAPAAAWAMALLLVVVAAGAYLRLYNIGRYGFWTDELFHVFAARSYLADGSMHIPWKTGEYTRALPVTYLTIFSFKVFGESEASARLPFALANIVFILVAYRILENMFSRNVGLIFAMSMSLSIFAIQMSQECRMYTLFQFLYFLMSIAFFRGLESSGPPPHTGVSWKSLALALALGFLAYPLQFLTLNFIFVALTYSTVMFIHQSVGPGFRESLRSKYAIFLALTGMLALVLATIRPQFFDQFVQAALHAPTWNRSQQSNWFFYQRVITDSHPILWVLYPLGALVAIHRFGRKGLFFVLSFCVLYLMHCFLFAQHAERYVFHLLPFFLAIGAVALEFILSSMVGLASRASLTRQQRALVYSAMGVSLLLLVAPRIQRTILDTAVPKFSNWKGLDPALVEAVRQSPSLTTERWGFNYYFGKYPNYIIESTALDNFGDAVLITSLEELEKAIGQHPDLYLVTYKQELYNDAFVSASMRAYILQKLVRVDNAPDIHIMVFRKPQPERG